MSVGVSLPHFTSPSSNGSQMGFFTLAVALTLKEKKFWECTCADLKKKNINKKYVLSQSVTRVHPRDTWQHLCDTSSLGQLLPR